MNIAPRVSVILASASIVFGIALQIAQANGLLKNFKPLIPYLFGIGILLLLWAGWTAFRPKKDFESEVTEMMRKLRTIKNQTEKGPQIAQILPDKNDDPEIFAEAMRRIDKEDAKRFDNPRWSP